MPESLPPALRAGAVLATLAVVVGCTAGAENDPLEETYVSSSGLDVTADVDPVDASIVFPGDRFTLSDKEVDLLRSAQSYAIAECVQEKGLAYTPFGPSYDEIYDASNYFGVWTVAIAERFGSVKPMTVADLRANMIDVEGGLPQPSGEPVPWGFESDDEELVTATYAECASRPEAELLTPETPQGPWNAPLAAAFETARETERSQAVLEDYHSCLQERGLKPIDDASAAVNGQNPREISADQIALALQVVECKSESRFVERLADEIALAQAPIIDEYASELVAQREALDESVRAAQELLAAKGIQ